MGKPGESLFGTNDVVQTAAIAAGLRCSLAPELQLLDHMTISRKIFPAENLLRCECAVDAESARTDVFELLHQALRPRFVRRQPSNPGGMNGGGGTSTRCKLEEHRILFHVSCSVSFLVYVRPFYQAARSTAFHLLRSYQLCHCRWLMWWADQPCCNGSS